MIPNVIFTIIHKETFCRLGRQRGIRWVRAQQIRFAQRVDPVSAEVIWHLRQIAVIKNLPLIGQPIRIVIHKEHLFRCGPSDFHIHFIVAKHSDSATRRTPKIKTKFDRLSHTLERLNTR